MLLNMALRRFSAANCLAFPSFPVTRDEPEVKKKQNKTDIKVIQAAATVKLINRCEENHESVKINYLYGWLRKRAR